MADGSTFTPLQTGNTRVFVIEGRARGDHEPGYFHQLKMMGVEQSFGDVENIYTPDPDTFGKFLVVGTVRAEEERPTTQLMGRYAENIRSTLLRLAKIGCENDVQLHMGECTDPSDFNEFDKALIIEGALIPTWSTDDLGALQPDEKAQINETADISGIRLYEIVPLTVAERGGDVLASIAVDVVICDSIQCGECEELSDGCQKIYVLSLSPGGSPGTPADVVFSVDGGSEFFERSINSMTPGDNPSQIACVGKFLVVTDEDNDQVHIALKDEFDGIQFPNWTAVTTGFAATFGPHSIWSIGNFAFIGAEDGYIYGMSDAPSGVEILDNGVALTGDVRSIHALSDQFAIAGDTNGDVAYTNNRTLWQTVVPPDGQAITAIWAKSETEFWAATGGAGTNALYYSLNAGESWTSVGYPCTDGAGFCVINDIHFASESVVYAVGSAQTTGEAVMWRSYDGGFSWNLMPDGPGILPTAEELLAVYACEFDPNMVVGVGDLDGSDGTIMIATD